MPLPGELRAYSWRKSSPVEECGGVAQTLRKAEGRKLEDLGHLKALMTTYSCCTQPVCKSWGTCLPLRVPVSNKRSGAVPVNRMCSPSRNKINPWKLFPKTQVRTCYGRQTLSTAVLKFHSAHKET